MPPRQSLSAFSFLALIISQTSLVVSSSPGSVVVDGYTFSSITNGTGQVAVTGGDSLKISGTGFGSGTADTQSVYTQFDPIALSVGDSIRFEFTLIDLNYAASASGLRIAFATMPSSTGDVATLNPNWASGTRANYTLLVPVVTNTVPGSGNVLLREAVSVQNPLAGTGITYPTLGTYSLANGPQTTGFAFQVVRDTTESVQISGSIGSVAFAQQTDSSNPIISFNTWQVGLRTYTNTNQNITLGAFDIVSVLSGTLTNATFTNGTTDLSGAGSTIAQISGTAAVTVTGSNTVIANLSGGTVTINAAGASIADYTGGAIAITNDVALAISNGHSPGSISGAGGLVKGGPRTLTLTANNTYTGATTVASGSLVLNGTNASAATVQSGALLGGSGTLSSATIQNGATISPGNSPGTLTLTNGLVWEGGGNYDWQIFNVSGTAGGADGWDVLAVTGGVFDITALSATNPFNINLWSLSGSAPDVNGSAASFDNTQSYTWELVTFSGLSGGFDKNKFILHTTATNGTGGFVNELGGGLFSLAVDGDSLNLLFTPTAVPEPATWLAAALMASLAGWIRLRHRKRDRMTVAG